MSVIVKPDGTYFVLHCGETVIRACAFHNDNALKEQYLQRAIFKAADGRVENGYYHRRMLDVFTDGNSYHDYETLIGVPHWIGRLSDAIVEGMSRERMRAFPGTCLQAIPVGVNINAAPWILFREWMYQWALLHSTFEGRCAMAAMANLLTQRIEKDDLQEKDFPTGILKAVRDTCKPETDPIEQIMASCAESIFHTLRNRNHAIFDAVDKYVKVKAYGEPLLSEWAYDEIALEWIDVLSNIGVE